MLGLLTPTDPRWVAAARDDLPGLLSDHAHCELKAAHSALSLVSKFGGDYPSIVEPLSALAMEETDHFRQVHDKLSARECDLKRPEPDGYVNGLWNASKGDRDPRAVLMDRLLVGCLIEARSCERFKLLSEHIGNDELGAFYRELMASEARHYRLFCGLAEQLFGVKRSRERLGILAEREAQLADQLPLGPRVHG